jgi:hypothetical protein
MNWLIQTLIKEARGRRFNQNDKVRYFTENRKGKGKGVVLTPSFSRGTVLDFDAEAKRYKVQNDSQEVIDVHPRNLIPDISTKTIAPISTPVLDIPTIL